MESSKKEKSVIDNHTNYYESILSDIYTMMNYARESGIDLHEPLRKDISKLLGQEFDKQMNFVTPTKNVEVKSNDV